MTKPKKNRLNLTPFQKRFLLLRLNTKSLEEIDTAVLKMLKEQFKKITDVRQQSKISYKIWDIITYVVFARFANIYDWEDIELFVEDNYSWFKSFLQMTGGVPNHQTIERVFSLINPKELETILNQFYFSLIHLDTTEKDIISIDGKVNCGSSRKESTYHKKRNPLNVLNAYSSNYGICLASEMIDDKSNEIPTIPVILERLKIKDTIITWDALNT